MDIPYPYVTLCHGMIMPVFVVGSSQMSFDYVPQMSLDSVTTQSPDCTDEFEAEEWWNESMKGYVTTQLKMAYHCLL